MIKNMRICKRPQLNRGFFNLSADVFPMMKNLNMQKYEKQNSVDDIHRVK